MAAFLVKMGPGALYDLSRKADGNESRNKRARARWKVFQGARTALNEHLEFQDVKCTRSSGRFSAWTL
jgi:hypothetical protein